jgi:hypothetical protein
MRRRLASGKLPPWPGEPLELAMEEKPDIGGMPLARRLIVEVCTSG